VTRKRTADEARRLLASRRARLGRLLRLDAPDIIVWHEMRMVARSQREVHGRGWHRAPLGSRIRAWWTYGVRQKQTIAQWEREDAAEGGQS
jgi:hypothetical protein